MKTISFGLAILIAALIGLLSGTQYGTLNVKASIDCSQPNPDSRCSQVQSTPPPPPSCDSTGPNGECISHHGQLTVYCLAGVFLGTWVFPANAANAGSESAFCEQLP